MKSCSYREQLRIDDQTEYLRYVYNASKYLSKAVVSVLIFLILCFVAAISNSFLPSEEVRLWSSLMKSLDWSVETLLRT